MTDHHMASTQLEIISLMGCRLPELTTVTPHLMVLVLWTRVPLAQAAGQDSSSLNSAAPSSSGTSSSEWMQEIGESARMLGESQILLCMRYGRSWLHSRSRTHRLGC